MNAVLRTGAESPFFFDLGSDRLFGFVHQSTGTARATIVMCHAFAEEKLWSHRVYVTFAREMTQHGYNVLRFDMRGEGDSGRDFEEMGIASRVEDTLRAIDVAQERFGGAPASAVVLLGHRLGGNIAAVAASRAGGRVKALVAWDPVMDGADYFGQLLRSNMATQMATQGKVTRTRDALVKAILEGETVIADGYGLTSLLHREMSTLSWERAAALQELPALVVEVPKGEQTTPSAPLAAWSATGRRQVALAPEPPFWRETRQFHKRAAGFTRITLDWLQSIAP